MEAEPRADRGLRAGLRGSIATTFALALLVLVSIGVLLEGPHLLGALLLGSVTLLAALTRPAAATTAILALFPFQPLAVRVLERDFGVTGQALVIASAWKEVALGTVLITVVAPYVWRASRQRTLRSQVVFLDLVALALVALVGIGMLAARDAAALNQARLMLFPIGMYLILRVGLVTADRVVKAILGSGVVVAAFGIVQASLFGLDWVRHYFGTAQVPIPATFTATFLSGPRASGSLGSPNEFAFMVGVCAVIAVALLTTAQRREAAFAWSSSLFVLLPALALSFSRSAILGCIAGIAVALILIFRVSLDRGRLVRLLPLTLVPALLVTSLLFVSRGGASIVAGTIDTVGSLGTDSGDGPGSSGEPVVPGSTPAPGTDPSTIGHLSSLSEGVRLLIANPLGIGLGNVGAHGLPGQPASSGYVVESWYLSMGLALGVLGLVWSVLAVASMFVAGVGEAMQRAPTSAGIALVGVAAMTGIVSFLLPTMLEPQLAMLPFSLAAVVGLSESRSQVPHATAVEA